MSNDLRIKILLNAVDRATAPFRSVSQQVQQATQKIKQSRDAIKAINETTKKIEGFKKLQSELSQTANKMQEARAKVRELRQQMQQTAQPTEEMRRAMQRAQQEAQRLSQRHQNLTREQRQASDALRELGINTNRLGDHERELQQRLNRTNQELEEQRRAAQRLQQQQERLNRARQRYDSTMNARNQLAGTGAGMIAAGTATGLMLAKPISAFAETEDAATQLKVTMMGATGEVSKEFEKINQLALKLGDRLPGTTADFQNMMTVLRRQGMSANAILGGLGEATAYLAVQLKMPTEAAAEFAAKMQDATSATETEMMGLMDTIQRGFYLGVDDNNMLEGFANLSPLLKTLKLKGKEAADALMPLLVITDQAAIKGSSAGIAINKAFSLPLDAAKVGDANELLTKFGIKEKLTFTKDGNSLDIKNLFSQFEKLKKLNDEQFNSVFKEIWGDDAETKKTIQALMNKGYQGYEEVIKKMQDQASLQQRVDIQLATLKNLWEAAGGTFTNTLASFAETVAPELKELTTWLGEIAEKTNAWIKANPKLAGWIFKLVAGFSALAVAGGAISLLLASILGPFAILRFALTTLGIRIIPMIVVGFKGVLGIVGALFSPIGLVVAAIIAAAVLIYKYWEPIKAFFIGVWEGLKTSFEGISEGFEPLKPMFEWIGETISKAIGWIKNFIKPVKSTSQELQNAQRYGKIFGESLAFYIRMLMWPIKQVIAALSWLGGAISSATSFFSSKWDEAGKNTESTIGRIVAFWQLSVKGIGEAIVNSDFVQTLKDKTTDALNFFVKKWDEAGIETDNSLIRIGLFFKNSFDGITKEIINWGLKSGFKAKVDELFEYLTSIQMQFAQIGKDIAISIWNGIKNEFTALQSDISNLLKSTFSFGKAEVEVSTTSAPATAAINALQGLPKFDRGGFLGSGKVGLVGENGPELINGPANITSRLQTAKAASLAASLAMMSPADAPIHPFAKAAPISASQQTQSVTITAPITIHAAPGQSAEQIAQVVQRELQKQMRNASRSNLSSYRDS